MTTTNSDAATFSVTSGSAENGRIPLTHFANIMGCNGQNVSPEISWHGAPAGTKSFVVTIYDEDAATGSGWWHWVVVNIPSSTTSLPEGVSAEPAKLPVGAIETNSDMGTPGYGGPCPPVGETHRYTITVKALGVEKLDLPVGATGALVGMLSNMNSLGQATLKLTGAR